MRRILSSMKKYAMKPFTWLNKEFWDFIYKSFDDYLDRQRSEGSMTSADLYKNPPSEKGSE
jgi:hypothetical protein